MSARAILEEILALLRTQVDAVVQGDTERLMAGTARHEQLLRDLETAEVDGTPEELRPLYEQIEHERNKLQSLLTAESARVDFMLRMFLGGGKSTRVGYPDMKRTGAGGSHMLNRRT